MPHQRGVVMIALLALASCAAAQTGLKSQVESRCSGMGLKGCPQLADGVIAYADGDSPKGEASIKSAVAANSPAQMKALAKTLRPIVEAADEDTAKKLRPVLAILAGTAPSGAEQSQPSEKATSGASGAMAGAKPVAATSDVETATAAPTVDDFSRPCEAPVAGSAKYCRRVRALVGPAIVTNLYASGGCPADLFVTAGESATLARWTVLTPATDRLKLTGKLAVPAGSALYVGLRGDAAPTDESRCSVLWSATREKAVP